MFENNPQIHERQILDISECPKLVADVDPPIGASFRLSAVAQGVVGLSNNRRQGIRYATSICCSPRRPLGVRANAEEPLPG
jgi:hypothetical protein